MKLWKHHAAQPEADKINAVAQQRGEAWPTRYGGKYSSEWFFSKVLQILDEAPEVYAAAATLQAHARAFARHGASAAWERVVGLVVQQGSAVAATISAQKVSAPMPKQ